jgi:iron complex outermembrane receptor protein
MKLRKEQWSVTAGNQENTNLDRSHKYGLEFQDKFNFNNSLSLSANYAWTRAIILSAPDMGGMACLNRCAGNTLPGTPEHTIALGINYAPTSMTRVALTQNFRSEAFNEMDVENDDHHKQKQYTSTDLSYSHILQTQPGNGALKWWTNGPRHIEFVAKIENLFDQTNGTWLKRNTVYPDLYTRNWTLGAKLKF